MSGTVTHPAQTPAGVLLALSSDIKLHHSIFALPWAVLSMVVAAHRVHGIAAEQVVLILICMVTARTVAMLANRYLDAAIDAVNPRTARRAIPSGQLATRQVFIAGVIAAVIFTLTTGGFWVFYRNPWPVVLALPVLVFLVGYSFMKRFTRFCHYYLGAALGLAPVCAWLAVVGRIDLPPVLMGLSVLLWTAGFDILYACQDYQFDVEQKLFSVPAKIGIRRALWVARATHAGCLLCLVALLDTTPELGSFFTVGIIICLILMIAEHAIVRADDLSRLNLAFFTFNGLIALLLGAMGTVDTIRHW